MRRVLPQSFPRILVVEAQRVRARLEAPKGRQEIEETLAPWLR